MKLNLLSRMLIHLICIAITIPPLHAEPQDQTSVVFVRTADNAAGETLQLSRNLYRTETYQDNYTVEVPYQEEEVYYEDVPYQEVETYTEWEEYWEWERVCRDHTRYEEVCKTVRKCTPKTERRCETKEVCRNITDGLSLAAFDRDRDRDRDDQNREEERRRRQEEREREQQERERERQERDRERERDRDRERQERERDRERQREEERRRDEERRRREEEERRRRCRQERVCEDVVIGETCEDKRVCKQVPRTERRCENEQVRKTRPVERTRIVTRYRSERRTRMVTRYRTETRCCITKEREVFDRQYSAELELKFPIAASLEAGESESILVELEGAENTAKFKLSPKETIYAYKYKVSKVGNGQFIADINVVPAYKPGDLGADKLSALRFVNIKSQTQVLFDDLGIVKKVSTQYLLNLFDAKTKAKIGSYNLDNPTSTRIRWNLGSLVPAGQAVLAQLQVLRAGPNLTAPVKFVSNLQGQIEEEPAYNPNPYMDKNLVGKFSIEGRKEATTIFFRDLTEDIPQVESRYFYKVSIQERNRARLIGQVELNRSDLKPGKDGRIALPLATTFQVSPADLALLKKNVVLVLQGEVQRFGSRLPKEPFSIPKKVNLTVK